MRTVVSNGVVLDVSSMTFIDAAGQFVVPGLIDGHVHFRLATLNFRRLSRWTEVEFGIHMARLARDTVERGFTTVRDLGGDVTGLMRAIGVGGPSVLGSCGPVACSPRPEATVMPRGVIGRRRPAPATCDPRPSRSLLMGWMPSPRRPGTTCVAAAIS